MLSAVLIVLALAAAPAAVDFETGPAAYRTGDFTAAIDAWHEPAVQVALGTLYVTGEGASRILPKPIHGPKGRRRSLATGAAKRT